MLGRRLFLYRLGAQRIEADVDDVRVDQPQRHRQRETDIGIDMGESGAVDRVVQSRRFAAELRYNGLGIDAFLHHHNAQRHVKRTGAAGRAGDDAAFDADLHGHDASVNVTFARGAQDRTLVAHVERGGLAFTRLAANHQGRRAGAYFDPRTLDIVGGNGVRIGRLALLLTLPEAPTPLSLL